MPFGRRELIALALTMLLAPSTGQGMSLAELARKSVLYVINDVSRQEYYLTRELLADFPVSRMRTATPWSEAPSVFEGIMLSDLAEKFGVGANMMHATAFNDYQVDVSIDTAIEHGAMVAFSRDGKPLTRRNQGPFWIVFPWSDRPELNRSDIKRLSVWQMVSIRFD